MANTNLYQSDQVLGGAPKKGISFDKGMIFSGVLLVLVFSAYGGVNWYSSTLEKQKNEIEQKISIESEALKSPEASQVADFQRRLTKIDENLKVKTNPTEILDKIEKTIIPEAVIVSFKADNVSGTLDLVVSVDNFRSMAKQVLIFKKEGIVNDVSVTEVGRDEEGRIIFSVDGKLTSYVAKSEDSMQSVQ
jgi:hypothetical protein